MDRRTKRQKLEAMANQSVSPQEADIAKRKLAELPPDPTPTYRSINIVFTTSYSSSGTIYDLNQEINFADWYFNRVNNFGKPPFETWYRDKYGRGGPLFDFEETKKEENQE